VNTVSIGLVGLGWWACETHIPNLLQVPGASIAALCSRNPENIQRGREALKGKAEPLAFSSYDELLACDALDAVVICTPNYAHGPMTLKALQAGKHVLVEKPLATDPAECRAIVEEAEKGSLVVQVGVELRYSDVAQTMRRLIEEGIIGEPTILRSKVWRQWGAPGAWRADESKSGGLFHELGVHYIDLLGSLVDRPALWAAASGGSKVTGRDLDYAFTTIGYEGGAVAAFAMCLFAAGGGEDIPLEVIGPEGRLIGEVMEGKVELWQKGGKPEDRSPKRSGTEVFGFPGSLESVASFAECVRTGARPWADAVEGERLCRVCEAARQSARAGGEQIPVVAAQT